MGMFTHHYYKSLPFAKKVADGYYRPMCVFQFRFDGRYAVMSPEDAALAHGTIVYRNAYLLQEGWLARQEPPRRRASACPAIPGA